jgi:hypothetical protein
MVPLQLSWGARRTNGSEGRMAQSAIHVLIFDGFADWEPAHALAELRRSGKRDVVTVGFDSKPVLSMGGPGTLVASSAAQRQRGSDRGDMRSDSCARARRAPERSTPHQHGPRRSECGSGVLWCGALRHRPRCDGSRRDYGKWTGECRLCARGVRAIGPLRQRGPSTVVRHVQVWATSPYSRPTSHLKPSALFRVAPHCLRSAAA